MRHYRIKEIKKNNKKQYIIQHHNKMIAGLYFWQKSNNIIYTKYEDALNEVKRVINEDDYKSGDVVYHYIDAHKLIKSKKR